MLCKCSGKYIDIYFILKITFQREKKKRKAKCSSSTFSGFSPIVIPVPLSELDSGLFDNAQ